MYPDRGPWVRVASCWNLREEKKLSTAPVSETGWTFLCILIPLEAQRSRLEIGDWLELAGGTNKIRADMEKDKQGTQRHNTGSDYTRRC